MLLVLGSVERVKRVNTVVVVEGCGCDTVALRVVVAAMDRR